MCKKNKLGFMLKNFPDVHINALLATKPTKTTNISYTKSKCQQSLNKYKLKLTL